jgi:hypothetical protein
MSPAMDIVFGGEEGSLTLEVSAEGRVDRALLVLGPHSRARDRDRS